MSYTITLRSEDGSEEIFDCDADQYILDAAEEAGVDHPSSVEQVHVHLVL